MSAVKLIFHNGTALVQRDLTASQDCPKCLSLEAVPLAEVAYSMPESGHAPALWASVRVPVRCRLCDTEYARRDEPKPLRVPVDVTASCERTERALQAALDYVECDRLERTIGIERPSDDAIGPAIHCEAEQAEWELRRAMPGAVVTSRDRIESELPGYIVALEKALDEHEEWAASRTLRERLRHAWRGFIAGWRYGV